MRLIHKILLLSGGGPQWIEDVAGGTNLLTHESEFDNAAWTKVNGLTVTANATLAPTGLLAAEKVAASTTGGGVRQLYQIGKTLTVQAYTWSFYAKQAELSWVKLNAFDGTNRQTYFNLATGAVGTTAVGDTASIESVVDGWFRCIVSRTAASTANGGLSIEPTNADGSNSPSLTSGEGIYIWKGKLETGATAT